MTESLLTPEVRALIGGATTPYEVIVRARHAAMARDLHPPSTVVPSRWLEAGEQVTGTVLTILEGESGRALPFPRLLPDSLMISSAWEFERPFRVGETLIVDTRLAAVTERLGGRFGQGLQIRYETVFCEPGGAIVAKSVFTDLQYDARNTRDAAAPGD